MSKYIAKHLASLEEFEVEEIEEVTPESDESETKDEILEFTDNAAEVLEEHQEVENLDVNGNPETVQEDVLDVAPDTSGEALPDTEPAVDEEVELDEPPVEEAEDTDPVSDDGAAEVSLDDDVVDTDESIDSDTSPETGESDLDDTDLDESEELEEADLEKGELDIPEPEDTTEAEVAEAEDEAADVEADVEEEDEEIEELEEDIEDLEEDKASVESYLAVLRHGVKTGVYSTQVVALTQERMLRLNERLHGSVKVASIEDFNSNNLKDYYIQNIASLEAVETKLTTVLGNLGKDIADLFASGSRYTGYKSRCKAINKESDRLLGLVKGEGKVVNKQRLLAVPGKELNKAIAIELAIVGKFIPLAIKSGAKLVDDLMVAYELAVKATKEAELKKAFETPSKLKAIPVPVVYTTGSKLDGFKVDFPDKPTSKDNLKGIVKALMPVGDFNKTTATGETLDLKETDIKNLLTLAKALVALVDKSVDDFGAELRGIGKTARRLADKEELNAPILDVFYDRQTNESIALRLSSSLVEQYRNTRNIYDVLVKRNFALAEAINSLVKQAVK